jgi:TRAP-type transport system periplasmic protein
MRLAAAALITLSFLVSSASARAEETITLGTVAPKQSIWGKVFSVWEKAVEKKSDGKLLLKVYYNGQQGDDGTMIGKLKAGQLDGAAVSSIGLAQIHKPVLALQMPGVFRTWEAFDKARDSVKGDFERAFAKEGFLVGFGDLGRLRGFTKGVVIKRPSDLKGRKVLSFRNDVVGPTVYQVVPGVSIVQLSATEVLPALRSQSLDVVNAPALAAEQLQWTPHLDHMASDSSVMAMGGLVWSKKRVESLPGDLRTILGDTGKVAEAALRKRIREEDDASFARLKEKMTVVTLSDDDKRAWKDVFTKVIERLKQGTFDPALVDKLVAMGG